MSKATDKQWRVQVRKSRAHKWVNKGLFETREDARERAYVLRVWGKGGVMNYADGVGFGNTRVIPYVKAVK